MLSLRKAQTQTQSEQRSRRPSSACRIWATALLIPLSVPTLAAAQTAYVGSAAAGGIVAVDTVSGRQLRPPIEIPEWGMTTPAITADGRTVYVLAGNTVVPVDTAANRAGAPIATAGAPAGGRSGSIAVTPDDKTVLVSSEAADMVTPISTATDTAGTPMPVEAPTALAVAPNGQTAYVTTAGRTLTPIDLATRRTGRPIALDHAPLDIAITPDGALAIVVETDSATRHGYVQVVDLTTGVAEAPVETGARPARSIALAADGRVGYVNEPVLPPDPGFSYPAAGGRVLPFDVAARAIGTSLPLGFQTNWAEPAVHAVTGDSRSALVTIPCNDGHCITGAAFAFDLATGASRALDFLPAGQSFGGNPRAIALAPDPSASFTVAPSRPGRPSSFDAGSSSNAGGAVSGYVWNFGDGTAAMTTRGPTVSHTYAQAGTYTATLTTTNHGGCAAMIRYTGRTASCTGSPTAATSRTVTVTPPPPVTAPATARTAGTTGVARSRATVHGTVEVAGENASWRFQYGITTRYGESTAPQAVSARRAQVPVHSTLSGLAPNTRYHYRLVVETPGKPGGSRGSDRTFTTRANGTVRVRSKQLAVVRGAVRVPVRCDSRATCHGRLVLATGSARCSGAMVRIAAHRTVLRRIAVGGACRSKLVHARSHRVTVKLTGTFASGQTRLTSTVQLMRSSEQRRQPPTDRRRSQRGGPGE